MQKTGYLGIPTNHEVLDTPIFFDHGCHFRFEFRRQRRYVPPKKCKFRFFRHGALEPIRNSCKMPQSDLLWDTSTEYPPPPLRP